MQVRKKQIHPRSAEYMQVRKKQILISFTRAALSTCRCAKSKFLSVTNASNSKYDVMAGTRLNFIENTVVPLAQRLAAAETPAVRAFGSDLVPWFDTDALPVMAEARRRTLQAARQALEMGVPLNVLNTMFDLGLPNFPWGDTPYVSRSLAPVHPRHP